jgi:spermidine synthase
MRALAHLPMLSGPDAVDALQICFGTGTTAAAFASHPTLRSLTVVDINPDVFELARHFERDHRGVLRDPRGRPRVDDGRRFLASTSARFDVISLEPPPPTADLTKLVARRAPVDDPAQRELGWFLDWRGSGPC